MTVMKMANSMLFSARLSHILWSSAVAHANLLRNRLPLSGLGPYTPYELFFHKRPRVDQLRVFGSDCYKLLPTYPKIPGQQARKRLIYCGESTERHLSKTLRASASTRSSNTTPGAIQVILFEIDCSIFSTNLKYVIVLSVYKLNKLGKVW